ncbi:MAG: Gfo/Idh/MocA family oxidoreductase [Lentisphaerae bacterium]|jgi:predicted dehydrogenase|nr:Gfo/Idh/MocA family oxidoreductase [Lentisphaerota bacterium]MBT4821525.1 Gfo/Idh/MocA family oxidoreductase [Lentisphaerota bacterium]MBT5605337.1 Gfo/Idh/MocA family oxidoreductase [Lentisphaerota bacterium]MBT7055873.1 Gfo/Idh/MocA family oxidoreductase [Lentisphaerota bacterium]MBT7840929.1 Gfo/Idh/MocA family oxidoreductase [Lentisphaerota bacterium]
MAGNVSTPINFAVIGCGMLGRQQHVPNIAGSPKTVLHTCCDLSDDALAECRDIHGALHTAKDYRAVIRDPEVQAICIATTEKLRLPLIAAAAEAGKPVYCEKPMCTSLEEMRDIQRVVKDAGIPFCVGHNRRSGPAMLEAQAIFREHMTNPAPCPWRFDREGENRPQVEGDGTAAMAVRINDDWYSWKGWALDKGHDPFGPMLFEMTHFTDLCNWFLDAEPEEVTALEYGIFNHGVVIKYETGELATIMMGANGTFGYPKELYEMFGNGAAVAVDHLLEIRTSGIAGAPSRKTYAMLKDRHPDVGTEGGLPGWLAKKRVACQEAEKAGDSSLIFTAEPDKGHAHAIDRFVDEIQGTGPMVCGVDDAVRATRVAFAAITSAHERRIVRLEEI